MARRKRRKNKERGSNKKLRFERQSTKKGVYTVRVFANGGELRGSIVSNEGGLVTIKYKSPNSNKILLRKIPEEQIVSVNPESVVVNGRMAVAEYHATKIIRKDGKIALITLEGEKVLLWTNDVDISAVVSVVKDEDEDEDDDDDDKKKKKKKKDDDEDEDEDDEDEDEDEDEPKKKKKKGKKEEDDDEDGDEGEGEDGKDEEDDLFADL